MGHLIHYKWMFCKFHDHSILHISYTFRHCSIVYLWFLPPFLYSPWPRYSYHKAHFLLVLFSSMIPIGTGSEIPKINIPKLQLYHDLFHIILNKMECKLHNTGAGLWRGVSQREFLETSRVVEAIVSATVQSARGPPLRPPANRRRLH